MNKISFKHISILIVYGNLSFHKVLIYAGSSDYIEHKQVNPSNAKATFVQSTRTQRFLKTI